MDTLQLIIIIVLIAAVAASFLILLKWGRDFVRSSRRIGMPRAMTLKEAVLIAFFFPLILSCGVGAFWLYRIGWEEFARTVIISIGFGLVWGVFMAMLAYVGNRAGRRKAKKKADSPELSRSSEGSLGVSSLKCRFSVAAIHVEGQRS